MKKRVLSLILVMAMVFTLAACGGGGETAKTEAAKTEAAKTEAAPRRKAS